MNKTADMKKRNNSQCYKITTHRYKCRAELLKATTGAEKIKFLNYLIHVYSKEILK